MNLDQLKQLLTQNTSLTPAEIDAFMQMAQKIEDDAAKASTLPTPVIDTTEYGTTGYFAPTDGNLRHAHPLPGDSRTPQWHDATNVHPATPDAHTLARSWRTDQVRWATANKVIPSHIRAQMIARAKEIHDAAEANYAQH